GAEPLNSHVAVASAMCGCGPISSGGGFATSCGCMRATKHHGPTVRRRFVGSTRSTLIAPTWAVRPSRTSIALMPSPGMTSSASSSGPLIGASPSGPRELARQRDEVPGRIPHLAILLQVALDEVARPEPALQPPGRPAPPDMHRELER